LVDLGAEIRTGDLIARVHNVARTGVAPQEYRAALDGILAARHFPGLIKMGDCLSVIATISEEPSSF
jgi:N-alpha-acetyl-L-2,4-diaminobutyrate deacetylase